MNEIFLANWNENRIFSIILTSPNTWRNSWLKTEVTLVLKRLWQTNSSYLGMKYPLLLNDLRERRLNKRLEQQFIFTSEQLRHPVPLHKETMVWDQLPRQQQQLLLAMLDSACNMWLNRSSTTASSLDSYPLSARKQESRSLLHITNKNQTVDVVGL